MHPTNAPMMTNARILITFAIRVRITGAGVNEPFSPRRPSASHGNPGTGPPGIRRFGDAAPAAAGCHVGDTLASQRSAAGIRGRGIPATCTFHGIALVWHSHLPVTCKISQAVKAVMPNIRPKAQSVQLRPWAGEILGEPSWQRGHAAGVDHSSARSSQPPDAKKGSPSLLIQAPAALSDYYSEL